MSSYKKHCEDCKAILGEEFYVVHRWLDEFYKYTPGDFRHRSLRHHVEGVEEVKMKWGDNAAKAAEIHIRADFPGLNRIPTKKDWEDLNMMQKNSDFYMELFK